MMPAPLPGPATGPTPHACTPTEQIGPRRWRTTRDLVYVDHRPEGAYTITVPAGFETDGASVPRALWTLIASPTDLMMCGPVLHDFIYRHQGKMPPGSVVPPRDYSRGDGDTLFRAVNAQHPVAEWRRGLAWAGVRVGGWWSWLRAKARR